ncbi:dienelactone hydrolase family protein [Candidatus Nucleicultrix amoebiphila]|jgi:dienelactone hydrolase|uniref:dienelactone hydrolase family protein n=1 Tax=Candidatus Nucleicultrix amoebiphila TaxID=1509244 RepID=UPI000A26AF2D|nr:dienelactone hydrolase family protein [Candidatus Nucleicultrix amoebiphila]
MKKLRRPLNWGLLFLCLLVLGCGPSRHELPNALTRNSDFRQETINVSSFTLLSYVKKAVSKTLRVYIEGDGLAWASEDEISPDPTPKDPLALRLALLDHSADSVSYLSRPCQYIMSTKCEPSLWTDKRFSAEIIESYTGALDQLKKQIGAERLVLMGYSGGGTLALLLAAHRQDVDQVITFAGVLDTDAWVKHFDLSPLRGSLNPADFLMQLKSVKQTHFIGSEDDVVPSVVGMSYLKRFKKVSHIQSLTVPDLSHYRGWETFWDKSEFNH